MSKTLPQLEAAMAHLALDVLAVRQQLKETVEDYERLERRVRDFHDEVRTAMGRLQSPQAMSVLDMRDGINHMHDTLLAVEREVATLKKRRRS